MCASDIFFSFRSAVQEIWWISPRTHAFGSLWTLTKRPHETLQFCRSCSVDLLTSLSPQPQPLASMMYNFALSFMTFTFYTWNHKMSAVTYTASCLVPGASPVRSFPSAQTLLSSSSVSLSVCQTFKIHTHTPIYIFVCLFCDSGVFIFSSAPLHSWSMWSSPIPSTSHHHQLLPSVVAASLPSCIRRRSQLQGIHLLFPRGSLAGSHLFAFA